jgi:diguanylate cyclase (GGDEF)-like protein
LGNFFLFLGIIVQFAGSAIFFNKPLNYSKWLLIAIAVLAWNNWIHSQRIDSYVLSIQPIVLFSALLFASHALLIWKNRGGHFSTRFTAVSYGLEVVLLLIRSGSLARGDTLDLLSPTLMQTIYIVGYTTIMMMSTVGLILMAMEHLQSNLEYMATHDSLTGALLRRAFIQRANHELERLRRYNAQAALISFDIDHFKNINDTYGHLTGDAVIKDLVSKTNQELRVVDSLGRYGGEEFVVLLPDTRIEEAAKVAERIRKRLPRVNSELPAYTASFGVASANLGVQSVDDWLSIADELLYKSKQNGRDQITVEACKSEEHCTVSTTPPKKQRPHEKTSQGH